MPHHEQTLLSHHSLEELYTLVADVPRYKEFLPWCVASRILAREEDYFTAELVIRFKAFRSKYTSKVMLYPQKTTGEEARIEVELVEGPFDYLTNYWRFIPEKQGTRILFQLDFKFHSAMLEKLIGSMYGRAVDKMVMAFEQRADELYGRV
jgi:coenzyme Q-binding protein COQ10